MNFNISMQKEKARLRMKAGKKKGNKSQQVFD